jgi:iron complex outermembrane receptor protein
LATFGANEALLEEKKEIRVPLPRPTWQPALAATLAVTLFHTASGQTVSPPVAPPPAANADAPAPAPTTAPAATQGTSANPQQLDAVIIVGRQQSGDYFDAGSGGATKTDTPLREVPQAVRIVTRQFIDDLSALRLDDVLDYVAGVSRQNNFGGSWDNVAMRGFAGHENTGMSLLRNGMAANRGFNAPRDMANVERLEFLKGTMGALYGISEPGGTVNIETKQPRFNAAAHSVEAYYGSYNYKRLALDSTGPLNGTADTSTTTPATLAYRLNVSVEDKDSFRDHVHSRRELLAPALAWKLDADTLLRYDGEWLRQRAPLDRGVVAVNGQLGVVPISRFFGEPADGDTTIDNQTHQLLLEHALSSDWQARAGVQYRRGTMEGTASEGHAYGGGTASVDTTGLLWRRLRYRDFASEDLAMQLDLVGKLRTGSIEHDVVVGAEAFRFTTDQLMRQQPFAQWASYGIDIYNPVYGQAQPELTLTPMNFTQRDRATAVYVQDQIGLSPQWKLLAGVRHDRYRQHIDDRAAGSTTVQEPSATSPRIGLTWLPTSTLSLYASAGRSFRPNVGVGADGEAFAPEKGTAKEVGLKWQSADGRLGGGAALFDIEKHNVLVPLAGTDFNVADDEVRNKGLELELAGLVVRGWRVALSYAYLDSELKQFPKHSGSAFVVHEMPLANGQLVGLGSGFTHVSKRTGDTAIPDLSAYTTAKLTSYWSASKTLRVSLDVDNLFDKTYYTSAYNNVWVTPGSPRTVTLGVQAKF